MKKWILCIGLLIANYNSPQNLWAGEINAKYTSVNSFDNQVKILFSDIDFGNHECLSYDVFYKAYIGYLNLKQAGKLNTNKEILTICDMSLSSVQSRMWIIDLKNKKLLCNTFVAHGRKSGDDRANHFSNRTGSRMTSLGFYITADTYEGEHGLSLHLQEWIPVLMMLLLNVVLWYMVLAM
jgi:L,D-transpeptidase catalytic domain